MSIVEKFMSMEYGPAPEDPREAVVWLERHERRLGHFIDGGWRDPVEGKYFDTTDPSTGETLASVAQGSAADVDAAVKAARAALPGWQGLSGHARARYLYALARLVQKHSRRFAVLETMDNGKPIRESRDIDIPLVARHFYYHAGWAQLLAQEFPGYTACGVVGQIIPWNFPLLMLAWKIAPALAAGNTVVLKPAEFTPLTALAFAEICQEVGLPAGVVNIVTGDGTTGEALVLHPDVSKIAFTGSTEVGRAIRKATASSHKRLSLELGGKSPFIIFEDADLDSAVEGLVDGIWLNQGQVCCAGSRLLMQESIAEPLMEKVRLRMSTLRVGPPLDKAIDVGAIVARVQLEATGSRATFARTLLSADAVEQCASRFDCGAAGNFWAGAGGDDVPNSAGSGGVGEQHGVWAGGERLEREHQRGTAGGSSAEGRRGLGEQHEPVRCGMRVWGLSRKRIRTRGWQGRDAGISGAKLVRAGAHAPERTGSDRSAV
jgi:aldehyde dehydrogenase (NAD+)